MTFKLVKSRPNAEKCVPLGLSALMASIVIPVNKPNLSKYYQTAQLFRLYNFTATSTISNHPAGVKKH